MLAGRSLGGPDLHGRSNFGLKYVILFKIENVLFLEYLLCKHTECKNFYSSKVSLYAKNVLGHGCANHDTEGKRFKSPIHCCDVTKPPYLYSGELCTSPCTVNSCLCTLCAVGAPGSASLCSEHVNQTSC